MTQACSLPYSSRPPPCYFLPSPHCFSFRFYSLIFFFFPNSSSIWPRSWLFAFPRILEAPGYFAPRTQLKSAPAQTRWLRSRSGPSLLFPTIWRSQVWEPPLRGGPPPPPPCQDEGSASGWLLLCDKPSSLRRGREKKNQKKKKGFLYLDAETRVSSERFRGADLERTRSLLAERLRGIGWSRAGPFFLVQIYALWNSAGLVTWGRVTGRRPKMDRRNRDEAVQAAHSHFYKFEETARTPGVIPYSEKCFYVQILTLFLKKIIIIISKPNQNIISNVRKPIFRNCGVIWITADCS